MARLVLLCTIALVAFVHADRYFWAFIDSPMGFGDKIRFYYHTMLLAEELGRTAVLSPFQITVTDYSFLKDVDFEGKGG
jgi:hypothetical protein